MLSLCMYLSTSTHFCFILIFDGQFSCFEYNTQRAEQLFPCSVHHLLSPEPLVLTYKYRYSHGMVYNVIEGQITVVPQVL